MNNFNFSVIEGNLKDDPIQLGDDGCVIELDSARSYTNKDGERVKETSTFNVITRDKLASTCLKYLKKGSRVLVSGKLVKKDLNIRLECKEVNFLSPVASVPQ